MTRFTALGAFDGAYAFEPMIMARLPFTVGPSASLTISGPLTCAAAAGGGGATPPSLSAEAVDAQASATVAAAARANEGVRKRIPAIALLVGNRCADLDP